jgi:hypothetical protein
VNDGGPAFPVGSGDMRDPMGLSMRDYFAAAALTGMLANDTLMADLQHALRSDGQDSEGQRATTCRIIARRAFLHADSMLTARKQVGT